MQTYPVFFEEQKNGGTAIFKTALFFTTQIAMIFMIIHNFSYQYTEAFLKMFYLIFGQAYCLFVLVALRGAKLSEHYSVDNALKIFLPAAVGGGAGAHFRGAVGKLGKSRGGCHGDGDTGALSAI